MTATLVAPETTSTEIVERPAIQEDRVARPFEPSARKRSQRRGPVWSRPMLPLALAVAAVLPIAERVAPQDTSVAVPESAGSMYNVVDQVGARAAWEQGFTGAGVNVAVIDTGFAQIEALEQKVIAAVDLSSEQSDPALRYADSNGHGTHMAGVIAGLTPGANPTAAAENPDWFVGVAPDAGLVSVKVAGRDGAVGPAELITAVDWVTAHASELGIGVVTLAFDAPMQDSFLNDPLAAAVERAWQAGVVVVTAAGNQGTATSGLSSPAYDPHVIAVGGADMSDGTISVPEWTTRGDGVRNPDLAAPGAHIESLRAPGSEADVEHPEARVGASEDLFLATGSSSSAAVVAGVAALLLEKYPDATPDQIKTMLTNSASPFNGDVAAVGSGLVNAVDALAIGDAPGTVWDSVDAPGTVWDSVDAPGTVWDSVDAPGTVWDSVDAPGTVWDSVDAPGTVWATDNFDAAPRVAGVMSVASPDWSSVSWSSVSWSSVSWSSVSWSSVSWSSVSWSSVSWSSVSWSSVSWSSVSWSSVSWSSVSWSSVSWSSVSWSSVSWSSVSWS